MNQEKPISCCCVLDASTYVGFWILKRLLTRGYSVHAAIRKNGKKNIYQILSSIDFKDFETKGSNSLMGTIKFRFFPIGLRILCQKGYVFFSLSNEDFDFRG